MTLKEIEEIEKQYNFKRIGDCLYILHPDDATLFYICIDLNSKTIILPTRFTIEQNFKIMGRNRKLFNLDDVKKEDFEEYLKIFFKKYKKMKIKVNTLKMEKDFIEEK